MEPTADPAFAPPTPPRARCVLRIRLPPVWTPDEDARLERLAKENSFRHWHRVARQMPRRSSRQCRNRWRDQLARDVYNRPFTARDDDELARLHQRRGGGRWKDISRAVYGHTSRVMKRRWRELRKSDTFLKKLWRPPLPAAHQEDVGMGADLDSPASSSQHPYADLLASAVASCSLSCGTVGSGAGSCTSLSLGFTSVATDMGMVEPSYSEHYQEPKQLCISWIVM